LKRCNSEPADRTSQNVEPPRKLVSRIKEYPDFRKALYNPETMDKGNKENVGILGYYLIMKIPKNLLDLYNFVDPKRPSPKPKARISNFCSGEGQIKLIGILVINCMLE